jgi:pyrroloquinoline quinone biosynthesis protein D
MTMLDAASRPKLARGVRLADSPAHGGWVILAPERVFKIDAVGVEIVRRCDGRATIAGVIDDLASAFAAPRERIEADVLAFLARLGEAGHLEFAP